MPDSNERDTPDERYQHTVEEALLKMEIETKEKLMKEIQQLEEMKEMKETKDMNLTKSTYIREVSKQDSIKVARNAKGDYTWEVKLYFDNESEEYTKTLNRLSNMVNELERRY